MHQHKNIAYIAVSMLLIFVALIYLPRCATMEVCGHPAIDTLVRKHATITTPKGTIDAEVADTPESRELGLSGRKGIALTKGMLFVFPNSSRYGFWMRDMLFPIDMVWINKQGVVVHTVENAKPEDYPAKYVNSADALYVLELGAYQAQANGIYLGVELPITIKK